MVLRGEQQRVVGLPVVVVFTTLFADAFGEAHIEPTFVALAALPHPISIQCDGEVL